MARPTYTYLGAYGVSGTGIAEVSVPADTEYLLVISVEGVGTAVTADGISMGFLVESAGNTNGVAVAWGLQNPPLGTYEVVLTDPSYNSNLIIYAVTDVDSTDPIFDVNSMSGNAAVMSMTMEVPLVGDNLILAGGWTYGPFVPNLPADDAGAFDVDIEQINGGNGNYLTAGPVVENGDTWGVEQTGGFASFADVVGVTFLGVEDEPEPAKGIAERVVINFHNGTGAVIENVANNITDDSTLGTIVADLLDVVDEETGVTLSSPVSGRVADSTGGGMFSGATALEAEICEEGIYRVATSSSDPYVYVLEFPEEHGPVNVRAYFHTTYGNQGNIRVRVQGGTDVQVNADDGGYAEFLEVEPDGSDQIVIEAWNADATFVFWNGIILDPLGGEDPDPDPDPDPEIGTFTDDFEATGGNGPLDGWSAYNPSVLPDAQRVDGYYDSGIVSEPGDTVWFYGARGRADWKLQQFPATGQPDKVYIFHNVGVGPSADPQDNLSFVMDGEDYVFCGVIIHTEDLTDPNHEFLVIGHRGNARATLESKTTENGISSVANLDEDLFGTGVTHCDIRLTLQNDGTVRWAYRSVGGSTWSDIFGTGISQGGGLAFGTGALCYIGIVTYADTGVPEPFRGTVASVELLGESGALGHGLLRILKYNDIL